MTIYLLAIIRTIINGFFLFLMAISTEKVATN